jgi:hypothetical protein
VASFTWLALLWAVAQAGRVAPAPARAPEPVPLGSPRRSRTPA